MPISEWEDLMPATVTYEAVQTRNDYGKPTVYSTAVTYKARVSYKLRRVISRVNNQDAVSNTQLWVNAVITGLSPDDRITLPDGSTPRILNWDTPQDEDGDHHTKIYFGG